VDTFARFVPTVLVATVLAVAVGCKSAGSLTGKVLTEFGMHRSQAEEEPSAEMVIRQRIGEVAAREIQRLNNRPESEKIVFVPIPNDPLGAGSYYKEQSIYDRWYLVDIVKGRASGAGERSGATPAGRYIVTVDYRYRLFKTYQMPSREDAMAAQSAVASEIMDYERYRYTFDNHGEWDGKPGRLVKYGG